MKTQLVDAVDGRKTFVAVSDAGDEPVEALTDFAKPEKLSGAHFTGIGAFSSVTLGFFDPFISRVGSGGSIERAMEVGRGTAESQMGHGLGEIASASPDNPICSA